MPCLSRPRRSGSAVRWHIAVGELVQILGRPRGVNRTADNPVDVLILTDVPLPLPIERLIRAAAVEASHDDIMIAAGYACLSGAAEAASAYPELWGKKGAPATRNATQKAFAAGRGEVRDKMVFLPPNANRVS
jgi:putative DNA primase/helicase